MKPATIERHNFPSYEHASEAATDASGQSDICFHATIATQGKREHISAMIPMELLPKIATNEKLAKVDQEDDAPAESAGDNRYNRKDSTSHVKGIVDYLKAQSRGSATYIMPNITLAIGTEPFSKIKLFIAPSCTPHVKQCIVVMQPPHSEQMKFPIVDGQHRYLAIKEIIAQAPTLADPAITDLLSDMISITLINETSTEQIQTDFVNLATTRPMTKGLKVSWDHNNPLSQLCLNIADHTLSNKVEREATTPPDERAVTISLLALVCTELALGKSGVAYQNKLSGQLKSSAHYQEHLLLCQSFFKAWRAQVEKLVGVSLEVCSGFKVYRRESLLFVSSVLQAVGRAVHEIGAEAVKGGASEHERRRVQQEAISFFLSLDFRRENPLSKNPKKVNEDSPFYDTLLMPDGSVPNSFDTINGATEALTTLWKERSAGC